MRPDVFGACGISSDSRTLQDGDLFLACQGFNNHGIDFL